MRVPALLLAITVAVTGTGSLWADGSALPNRRADAPGGSAFASRLESLSIAERERAILIEAARGNVPNFWRSFGDVTVSGRSDGQAISVTYRVAPEYFAIGSDDDYFLTPLTPRSCQMLADMLDCTLPTRKMVDDIYRATALKLDPVKIPPSPAMTSVPMFLEHNLRVREQRTAALARFPLGTLTGGHKKDVVLTPLLASHPGKVAIYGWHQPPDGKSIQPLYTGHSDAWVDYSHGLRLIGRGIVIDGQSTTIDAVLRNPKLSPLLSDEERPTPPRVNEVKFADHAEPIGLQDGIECSINRPTEWDYSKPVRLVIYAVPNGNTIEQTIGRRGHAGDDWRFDIQHIGAQARWLREHLTDVNLVVAYLACTERSWPAWRKKHGDLGIPTIVNKLRDLFPDQTTTVVLTGHSGGGSLTFGYLNSIPAIPDWIERIAFLDSNYAYDSSLGHDRKLAEWLAGKDNRALCVLAYDDASALLDGKPFVSASGGSWGQSHKMIDDLGARLQLRKESYGELARHSALNGRVQFLLHGNPGKIILHTRQVELNGFIHAMLTGTPLEGYGYLYFGPRVYDAWIEDQQPATSP